ncbi:MAG TPA: hypothetical protein VGJ20_04435 [Xanthobacteraceae bacterium]|jgi:hypothetical protein
MSQTKQTKTELLQMLAEAVRNTQPQPIGATQPEPILDAQPEQKRKARPVSEFTTKTKKARASARRKQGRR